MSKKNNNNNIQQAANEDCFSQIMSINLDNLRDRQYKALKKHVLKILNSFTQIIERDGDLNELAHYLGFSRAGDGYGDDNHFIDFGYKEDDGTWHTMDIFDVLMLLHELSGNKSKLNI